jgi:hypothetical protein
MFGKLGYVVTQTLSFSIFRYGMGNLDKHRPKHLVFLLLGTGWGTWICIDPHIEFFFFSVGGWGTWICIDPNLIHIQVPYPLPNNRKTQCLRQYISKFPIPLPNNWKTQCLGQYISKFPIPLPNNWKTQCFGQYISKFPVPLPNNRKTQCLGRVFLLLGTGWGTWICIDPNIELF